MKLNLATPDSKADTTGMPAAATHVLTYWPPETLRKKITRHGAWTIYTIDEWETGDYCTGDRWRIEVSGRTNAVFLAQWAGGELGHPVTLMYAGETEFGPVYWVLAV